MDDYCPIADYALLGDGRTAALVSRNGSIDWLPWPDFDSPSLFAALLDSHRGGRMQVTAPGPGAVRRRYLPGTNVLETRFDTPGGEAVLTDFLAVAPSEGTAVRSRRALVRLLHGHSGRAELSLGCHPRPNYASQSPRFRRVDERCVEVVDSPQGRLVLQASAPLAIEGERVLARLSVGPGDDAWVILGDGEANLEDGRALLDETVAFWRSWIAQLRYDGPFRADVVRSALALKAMIYAPTGAIVAAPTTSLPEQPGGPRNWDYRFSWLRDATLTLSALHELGYQGEAARFFRYLLDAAKVHDPADMQVLYGIRGEHDCDEQELPYLCGYLGSRPVRVGNAAARQTQLDIYGELVDAFYTFRELVDEQRGDVELCMAAVDYVADHWRERDAGIWEVRSAPRHFVHSKAMCWLALHRGVQLSPDHPRADHWRRQRDAVHAEVLQRGYDARLGSFVQAYDYRILDASLLRLPIIGFLPPDDPRVLSTIDTIRRRLSRYGLIYRYREGGDGLPGGEETFAVCSFWLVEALALAGRTAEAEEMFRNVLSYGNDLGLFAEEIDPERSRQWGNFPQAFTHLGLLRAAVRLERGRLRPARAA